MNIVALIPARGGSKRIPRKNIKPFCGHPLIAYTIAAANDSGIFSDIIVSTEDYGVTQTVFERCGRCRVIKRSESAAADDALDVFWVRELFDTDLKEFPPQMFAILRPTSPFRTADTIRRAYKQFRASEVDSLRAVEPVKQHPGKMWQRVGEGFPIYPLINRDWPPPAKGMLPFQTRDDRPWHSMPTQVLPQVFVQNASLEIAWSYVLQAFGTISGRKVAPFFTEGYEGFDLNDPEDWDRAEDLVRTGRAVLPPLTAQVSAPLA